MDDHVGESSLVARARAGGSDGHAAFRVLVERHQAWLVRYLYYVLGSMADAEDVAQDALVRAYEALPTFRGDAGFRTWLRRIATRLAYNHRRDARTRQRYHDHDRAVVSRFAPGPAEATEARDTLVKVLHALPYPYREILILRHVEALSVAEIAAVLDIGLSAAKMRLSRARDAFWDHHGE